MSQELTKEQKLTALVLSAPPAARALGHCVQLKDGTVWYCALARARAAAGNMEKKGLTGFAATLGFSELEARGIMNGWDIEAGRAPFYPAELTGIEGVELGKTLYHLVMDNKD